VSTELPNIVISSSTQEYFVTLSLTTLYYKGVIHKRQAQNRHFRLFLYSLSKK